MAREKGKRSAVISEDARDELSRYLAFRHKSRHLYSVHHDWDSMKPLLSNALNTWSKIRKEVEEFVSQL